jgi:pimeloyl-ACP methyl ester carboxylesterase
VTGRLLGYLAVCDPPRQTIADLAGALLASRSVITAAVKSLGEGQTMPTTSSRVRRPAVQQHAETGQHGPGRRAPLGVRYEVDGRRLLLHHSGSGGPAVVFIPGAGLVGLDYLNVHGQVSAVTTSVLYDRAGTGWSDDVTLPRNAGEVTAELRKLLGTAGVPPPYLLVGHSLGGAYARRYAQRYPGDVAGVLFLDPYNEGYLAYRPKRTIGGTLWQAGAALRLLVRVKPFYRRMFGQMLAEWPESVRRPLIEYHLMALWRSLREQKNLNTEVMAEVRDGGDMPDVPVIVLAAMGIDPFQAVLMPQAQLRELNGRKAAIYGPLAESVPRGEYRPLEGAGHSTLHTDRPDAVVQAIRDLLDRAA